MTILVVPPVCFVAIDPGRNAYVESRVNRANAQIDMVVDFFLGDCSLAAPFSAGWELTMLVIQSELD
jgi:hypothetical protein